MKHWNKNKKYSETEWTKIGPLLTVHRNAEQKRWCQLNGSNDRFYNGFYTGIWYFENSEDALAFSLVWKNHR